MCRQALSHHRMARTQFALTCRHFFFRHFYAVLRYTTTWAFGSLVDRANGHGRKRGDSRLCRSRVWTDGPSSFWARSDHLQGSPETARSALGEQIRCGENGSSVVKMGIKFSPRMLDHGANHMLKMPLIWRMESDGRGALSDLPAHARFRSWEAVSEQRSSRREASEPKCLS